MEYLLVTVMQTLFILVKFLNIRHVMGQSLSSRMIVSMVANLVWLLAIGIGVKLLIQEDYYVVFYYMLGTAIGVFLEDKLRTYI